MEGKKDANPATMLANMHFFDKNKTADAIAKGLETGKHPNEVINDYIKEK